MATEKRLIYLDEAIAKVKDDGVLGEGYSDDERIDDVIDILESCHTVDSVEVIRCKYCVHWYEPEGVCLKIYSDGAVSPYAWQDRNPDDFCSYGERKDNG